MTLQQLLPSQFTLCINFNRATIFFALSLIMIIGIPTSSLADVYAYTNEQYQSDNQEDVQPVYNPHLQKAIQLHKRRNYTQAIHYYNLAIQVEPNSSELYFDRGLAKSESGDVQGAWHDLNRAIKLNPLNDSAYFNRGIVEYEMGQYREALRDFNETIRLVPGDAKALYNRALTKQALGDTSGALQDAILSRNYYKILNKKAEYREVSDFINSIRSRGINAY